MTAEHEGDRSPYDTLQRRVLERTGLFFPTQSPDEIALATQRMIRRAGVDSVEEYLARVDDGRVSASELMTEIRVGETYFFREPDQFAFLRDVVLPELAARRDSRSPIQIWSAGCATGEEPYSLAILLAELGLAGHAQILGTDLSRETLRHAEAAEYTPWSLRGSDAFRARRYLRAAGGKLRLDDEIRRRVSFRAQNLARDLFPSARAGIQDFDLILCRNVMIYFDPQTIADVARRLYASLAEGGWLITASSDPPLMDLAPFRSVVTERGVFYRKLACRDGERRAADTPLPAPRALPGERRTAVPPASARPHALPGGGQPAPAAPVVAVAVAAPRAPAPLPDTPGAPGLSEAAARLLAIADAGDLAAAEEAATVLGRRHPLNAEIQHLHGLILAGLGRDLEAIAAFRRAIYLDPVAIMAHLMLALAHQRTGDHDRATRGFRTVRRLCAALPQTALVPLGDGACAARVAAMAADRERPSLPVVRPSHG